MKTVILAGGFGTRISEATDLKPKPMIEIGGKPILWHIMKMYAHHGLTDFVICLGYKGYVIKEYFANYFLHNADVTFHLAQDKMEVHQSFSEDWSVTLVNTGYGTLTGGRLKRIGHHLKPGEKFCMTYGDGLADVNLTELLAFAKEQDKLATVTAIQPAGRFGALEMDGTTVTAFREKPAGESSVNGGFFVLDPKVLDLIAGDETSWEKDPLEALAAQRQLAAYKHNGFWHPIDTLRDMRYMEELWQSGEPPWRVWE